MHYNTRRSCLKRLLVGLGALGIIGLFGWLIFSALKHEEETLVPAQAQSPAGTPAKKRAVSKAQTARQISIGHLTPFGGMLYDFTENSGIIKVVVSVETATMVRFLPKGGKIKILQPDGMFYIDTPGVDVEIPKQIPGIFVITRAESSATGVEVNY